MRQRYAQIRKDDCVDVLDTEVGCVVGYAHRSWSPKGALAWNAWTAENPLPERQDFTTAAAAVRHIMKEIGA